jgi:Fic family protein
MQSNLRNINNLVEQLKSLPAISSDDLRKLEKKFRLEFSYNSNHIEGNTLTYSETELLLIFDKTEGVHEMREFEEMKAHDVAFSLVKDWANNSEHPLTETYIKQLNEIILVRPFWKEAITPDGQSTRRLISAGEYKKHPNSVRLQNGEIFAYASPTDTPIKMGELISWYNEEVEKKELPAVALAALLHYKFVLIHPFDDGNGRLSRLLMNYVLLKNGLPPIIIKTADKKNYLNALNQADAGNINAFVEYIAEQLLWSLNIVLKATKGESIDEPGDYEKKLEIFKKELGEPYSKNVKLDSSNAKAIIEKNIIPFIALWDTDLEKFNVIFYSKSFLVRLNDTYVSGENLLEIFNNCIATFFNSNTTLPNLITISVNLKDIKKPHKVVGFNGGQVEIKFSDYFYDVNNICCSKIINKSYNSSISDTESKMIISDIGNWVLTSLESFLSAQL